MSEPPARPESPVPSVDKWVELDGHPVREVFPGFKGRFIHSAHMTFVHWTIEAAAVFPRHAHPHEQVVNMIEGEFELTVDGETRVLGPRGVAIIPANAMHSGKALTRCRILDVFYPIREDYRDDRR
jgi:quercetin dioxygenase-like cupin family protein